MFKKKTCEKRFSESMRVVSYQDGRSTNTSWTTTNTFLYDFRNIILNKDYQFLLKIFLNKSTHISELPQNVLILHLKYPFNFILLQSPFFLFLHQMCHFSVYANELLLSHSPSKQQEGGGTPMPYIVTKEEKSNWSPGRNKTGSRQNNEQTKQTRGNRQNARNLFCLFVCIHTHTGEQSKCLNMTTM